MSIFLYLFSRPCDLDLFKKAKSQSSLALSNESKVTNEEMGKRNRRRNSMHQHRLGGVVHKHTEKKKKQRQIQNKIDKLRNEVLNVMQNQSSDSINSSYGDSVVVLDDTIQTITTKKRNLSNTSIDTPRKSIKINNSSPVVIADDDELIINNEPCTSQTPRKDLNTAPIDCSTPIARPNVSRNNNTDTVENFNIDANNLTKEINRDSYLTIDLTTETKADTSQLNTVIDLDNTDNQDCTVVSVTNSSWSMSGDSNVTVLQNPRRKKKSKVQNMTAFVDGIAKLNASDKGKLLEMITQKIFSGCKVAQKKSNASIIKEMVNQTTETVEDRYIKEVILGEKQSRNSIGSNIYNPERDRKLQTGLRMIVIDGSNVAMEHTKGQQFSVEGLKICIDYFLQRGHIVKAFVPRFRCKFGKSSQPRLLDELERRGHVIYTPSREIQGRMVTSYDDRYIVQCAAEFDAVIVSGDNYRDLLRENPRWRHVIENRLLQFTWVNDMIMFPRDPLGRYGPSLEEFLRYPARGNTQSSSGTVII